MKKFLNKISENRMIFDIIFLIIISIILSIPMFNKNIDIYVDDGSQHLMRAYGTYNSIIQNGNFKIINDFTNGFGYSWNLFYGPISTYGIILLSIILNSFNIGFKVFIYFVILISAYLMYKFTYELTENRNTSLLSSVIYTTSPYFFTDIYIRHAVGEMMAFMFIPMVFLGLYNLFNTEKNHYYLIFGAVRINTFT